MVDWHNIPGCMITRMGDDNEIIVKTLYCINSHYRKRKCRANVCLGWYMMILRADIKVFQTYMIFFYKVGSVFVSLS